MSRYYRVYVECTKLTEYELTEIMSIDFGWEDNDEGYDESRGIVYFEGEGNLNGGISKEGAHEQIKEAILKVNKDSKVKTTWTYLEDLPTNSYGDLE